VNGSIARITVFSRSVDYVLTRGVLGSTRFVEVLDSSLSPSSTKHGRRNQSFFWRGSWLDWDVGLDTVARGVGLDHRRSPDRSLLPELLQCPKLRLKRPGTLGNFFLSSYQESPV
jgi:hypothetical protein